MCALRHVYISYMGYVYYTYTSQLCRGSKAGCNQSTECYPSLCTAPSSSNPACSPAVSARLSSPSADLPKLCTVAEQYLSSTLSTAVSGDFPVSLVLTLFALEAAMSSLSDWSDSWCSADMHQIDSWPRALQGRSDADRPIQSEMGGLTLFITILVPAL